MEAFFERTWRCVCGRRTSRSPSPPPRWTSRACCATARGCRVCKHTGWLEMLRLRHGAPERAWRLRYRCRALHRLRLRHGHRSPGDAALSASMTCACSSRATCASSGSSRGGQRMKLAVLLAGRMGGLPAPGTPPSWRAPDQCWLRGRGAEPGCAGIRRVVVAEIRAIEPHPQADKLRVCRVDTGAGSVQIVCGAPNARAGMLKRARAGRRPPARRDRHSGGQAAWRRIAGHALLGAGARARRQLRGHSGAAARCAGR